MSQLMSRSALTAAAAERVAGLLADLPDNYTLPRDFYRDEDLYQLDLDVIFYSRWIFIGHTCEVPTPGTYFTVKVGDYSIIIIRGKDGRVRALHNVCRHRGATVCNAERGRVGRLVCPYHQWSYDLSGKLLYAREMGDGFNPADHGLREAHCETLAGYVFVCLAETPPSFDEFKAGAAAHLAYNDLENAKVAAEITIVEHGNWKLVMENNRECYHCPGGHPELSRTFSDDPRIGLVDESSRGGEVVDTTRLWDERGIPHKYVAGGPRLEWRVARVSLLPGQESETMDGQPACAIPMVPNADVPHGSLVFYYYPNTWNHHMKDHAISFRVLPLGPDKTEVTTKWMVRADAIEGRDYDLERLVEVWRETNAQDASFVEMCQRGVTSPAYAPGPYSAIHEEGTAQFTAWYLGHIRDRLDGGRAAPGRRDLRLVNG